MTTRADRSSSSLPVGPWTARASLKVLIVDDDPLVRETLACVMTAVGVTEVQEASGGMEAIARITRDPDGVNLIFCDLQMPVCDGLDVLEACAQLGMERSVVLMSGSGENNLRDAKDQAGAGAAALACTMAKPFSVSDVRALLDQLMTTGGPQPARDLS